MSPLQAMDYAPDAPAAIKAFALDSHVLFTSSTLKPDMSWEGAFKPGTDGERHSRVGSFTHGKPVLSRPQGCEPVQHRGTPIRGGLVSQGRIWGGGAPRDVPQKQYSNHGSNAKVLYTFPHLSRPDAEVPCTKPGTDGERMGRIGSFEHGDTHIAVKRTADFVLSELAADPKSRRFAGHLPRGAIFRGGVVRV